MGGQPYGQEYVIHPFLLTYRTEQGLNNTITVNPTTFETKILHSNTLNHLFGTDNKINTMDNIISYS